MSEKEHRTTEIEHKTSSEKGTEVQFQSYESDSASEKQHDHVFQDPKLREYYLNLSEKTQYECRHLVDSDLT